MKIAPSPPPPPQVFVVKIGEVQGGISSSILSVFFTDKFYKLLKSLHLIGWEQICQWKTLTKCLMKCPPGLLNRKNWLVHVEIETKNVTQIFFYFLIAKRVFQMLLKENVAFFSQILKPMDSFGTWRKWKFISFVVNAEFYRVVWTINALLTVHSEMLPFSENIQNIKMFRVPPNTLP